MDPALDSEPVACYLAAKMCRDIDRSNLASISRFWPLLLVLLGISGTVAQGKAAIQLRKPMSPPAWALLQRALLRANVEACSEFFSTHFDETANLIHTPTWGALEGPDDAYECFYNWTLLYALGASPRILEMFRRGQEAHLRQYQALKTVTTEVARNGAYYKEFSPMVDWHHIGEGLRAFLYEGLCDPVDARFQKRMRRFAGFYMNQDPEALNYDPKHKIIRSLLNGSRGPMLRMASRPDWCGDPLQGRFILDNLGGPLDYMQHYPLKLAHFDEYLTVEGDHPLNLSSTVLALNAYMLGQEEPYREWLLEYVDAWKERIIANGDNIPTNIGLDGSIGGVFGGRWWGGTYGWNFHPWSPEHGEQHYRNLFDKGAWPGFGNALLLTGDMGYLDVLRRQMDNLYAQKKVVDGELRLPHNYGIYVQKTGPPGRDLGRGEILGSGSAKPGWFNWSPGWFIPRVTEIYLWSMDRKDLDRVPKEGWVAFLEGEDADYPVRALEMEFARIQRTLRRMRENTTSPDSWLADSVYGYNPAATDTLLKLMMGGYHGGLIWTLHSRLRYFDPVGRRAGIPEDVAALVTQIDGEKTRVTLVNVSQVASREVIVQTGGYGEHLCTRVEVDGQAHAINRRLFRVRLAPGAGGELLIHHRRYANSPTLAFPWHGARVPAP